MDNVENQQARDISIYLHCGNGSIIWWPHPLSPSAGLRYLGGGGGRGKEGGGGIDTISSFLKDV